MKYRKFYNARAEPLFCSLNLLFYLVLVAVAVVVCLRSLMFDAVTTDLILVAVLIFEIFFLFQSIC